MKKINFTKYAQKTNVRSNKELPKPQNHLWQKVWKILRAWDFCMVLKNETRDFQNVVEVFRKHSIPAGKIRIIRICSLSLTILKTRTYRTSVLKRMPKNGFAPLLPHSAIRTMKRFWNRFWTTMIRRLPISTVGKWNTRKRKYRNSFTGRQVLSLEILKISSQCKGESQEEFQDLK